MTAASSVDTITITIGGVLLFVAIVVVWRVLIHDRSIRKVRLGIFYERERDGDEEEQGEESHD